MENSHLEQRFENLWISIAPDMSLENQIKHIVKDRRYVFDFGIISKRVLFEINGGTYARGRSGHSSGKGIARDADKINRAQLSNHVIFVFTVDQLNKEYVSEIANFCREIAN